MLHINSVEKNFVANICRRQSRRKIRQIFMMNYVILFWFSLWLACSLVVVVVVGCFRSAFWNLGKTWFSLMLYMPFDATVTASRLQKDYNFPRLKIKPQFYMQPYNNTIQMTNFHGWQNFIQAIFNVILIRAACVCNKRLKRKYY